MAEENVIRQICDAVNGLGTVPLRFLPEGERTGTGFPAGFITALGGSARLRAYVDGSYVGQVLFAAGCRIAGGSPAASVQALDWLETLRNSLEAFAPPPGNGRIYGRCRCVTAPSRSAADADGTEEYRAVFSVEYRASAAGG